MLTLIAVAITAVALGSMTVMAETEPASGTCGTDVSWSLDTEGRLTISGTGAMDNFQLGLSPFYAYKTEIKVVEIQEGVTSVGDSAFYQCTEIPYVYFPSTLERIGSQAFRECSSLSSANIPASEIGEYAFYQSGLGSVFITGNVTEIETAAFGLCANLSKIQLPITVERIGKSAFIGCGLRFINESDWSEYDTSLHGYVSNIKYRDKDAFSDCENLTSVTLPKSLISIGEGAFYNCGINTITVPDGVETIMTSAFSGCSSLSKVNLPDSLTEIGARAFEGCSSLSEIIIPKNVESIGEKVFVQANSINDVYCFPDPAILTCSFDTLFPDNVNVTIYVPGRYKDAYSAKFGNDINFVANSLSEGACGDNVNYVLDCDNVLVISGTGDMYDFEYGTAPWYDYTNDIKEVIIQDGVTSIGKYSFHYARYMTAVTISDSVKTIGENAFTTCLALKSIVIPDGVTSIGRYAFTSCISLSSVTLPDSVSYIGQNAFGSCIFKKINIPGSLTSIEASTYNNCNKLESVIIPNGVTSIGDSAFNDCSSLASVTIPGSVNEIGESAFNNCSALTSIRIPAGVTEIKEKTFFKCTSLASVYMSEGITTIGNDAFNTCSSLSLITIPDSVTGIGHGAFNGCAMITSLSLPDGLTAIASTTFAGCSSLTSINIPANVASISFNAFKGCISLASITIPNSVTSIDNEAFSECDSLISITIPGSVTDLGQKIFYGCDNLKTVTMLNGVSFIGYAAFASCPNLEQVILPSTITGIGQQALNADPELSDIYILANPANLTWNFTYQDYPATLTVHVPSGYVAAYEKLFADNNVNVTVIGDADGDIDLGIGVHLYGYSLSLEGDIGVNFYVKFDDVDALSSDAKMVFTITGNNGQDTKTQEVYVKPQANTKLPYAKTANGYYIFKCTVYSNEMTSTITAQVISGEASGQEFTYSVQEYAKYLIDHASTYTDEQPLIKAMLNYGAYSQKYFNYNMDNLANSILPVSDQTVSIMDPSAINAGPRDSDLTVSGTNIKIEKVSLSLKDTISMKLYISGADDNTVFMQPGTNDKIFKPVKIDGYYVITIDGIKGQYIDWAFGIKVYDGDTFLDTISYSPVYYCKNVLSKENGGVITTELKELVSSMVLYKDAAATYSPPTYN